MRTTLSFSFWAFICRLFLFLFSRYGILPRLRLIYKFWIRALRSLTLFLLFLRLFLFLFILYLLLPYSFSFSFLFFLQLLFFQFLLHSLLFFSLFLLFLQFLLMFLFFFFLSQLFFFLSLILLLWLRGLRCLWEFLHIVLFVRGSWWLTTCDSTAKIGRSVIIIAYWTFRDHSIIFCLARHSASTLHRWVTSQVLCDIFIVSLILDY